MKKINLITKKKRKFKKLALKRYKQDMQELGWANKSEFFDKALKSVKDKEKITRVPVHILEEKEKEGIKINSHDPVEVKKIIKEYWELLYKKRRNIEHPRHW
eukprot:Phypoly_transcript_04510.p3 GENE.Phypoly_transcript_04510~~Phypoly_transcript_04510.p3  ORF type:complete len:102 (+),score=24.06 Phypoly_transcript_04510:1767-2072(+)